MNHPLSPFCRNLGLSLGLLAVLLSQPGYAGDRDNIIKNGDLEDAKKDLPADWGNSEVEDGAAAAGKPGAAKADFGYVRDTDGGRRHVLYIKYNSGSERAMWKQPLSKEVVAKSIKPGKKYEFSLWVKYDLKGSPDKKQATIFASWSLWGADWEKISTVFLSPEGNTEKGRVAQVKTRKSKSDWQELKAVFKVPEVPAGGAAPNHGVIIVGMAGVPGELWIDDFRLVEVPDSTPVGPFVDD